MQTFLEKHVLPQQYLDAAARYFDPVIKVIAQTYLDKKQPLLIGLNGTQGSGKTTCADYFQYQFTALGLNSVAISLDDFYLGKAARQTLSENVHPLLRTRGVPGTHDIPLLKAVLSQFREGQTNYSVPRFNKALDDRHETSEHTHIATPLDILILEGWCWGAEHCEESALLTPINTLESEQDGDGHWRHYVNEITKRDYEPLYDAVDYWLMLKAPSFDCVYQWRLEQEDKLKHTMSQAALKHSAIMSNEQIAQFIQYFQRVTEELLDKLPSKADCVWHLNQDRSIETVDYQHQLNRLMQA